MVFFITLDAHARAGGYVIGAGIHLLPARASEQGNVIGSVRIYIYIYIYVYKKKL